MAFRKILLPLTGTASGEAALATALTAARIWNAHVSCLHVRIDSRDVAPLAGEGLSGAMIEEMMTATDKESAQRSNAVRALFDRFVIAEGVAVGEPMVKGDAASVSFASVMGREEDLVAQQARLADLTVVPHPEAGDDVSSSDALHAVLFDSGRPVLIAPHRAPASLGTRVCIAWNGTAESAASVLAALPWMHRAEAVRILSAGAYQRRGPAAADLLPYLALHGIHPDLLTFREVDGSIGAGLLAAAKDFGCDLLSMGAYSHSRLRQLILGGVTRHVLEKAVLPVMMSRWLHGVADPHVERAVRAYVKLLRATRAVVARVEPRLAEAGLTVTQLGVLEALLHLGPLTPRELGRKVLTSAGNLSDVLDKLAARGLVRRVPAPADRRSVTVELTEAGRAEISALFPEHAGDIARAMAGLTQAELAVLDGLLRKLGRAGAGL